MIAFTSSNYGDFYKYPEKYIMGKSYSKTVAIFFGFFLSASVCVSKVSLAISPTDPKVECLEQVLSELALRYRQQISSHTVKIPDLVFDSRPLATIVQSLTNEKERTLIITTPELQPALTPLGIPIVTVQEITLASAALIRNTFNPEHVIAIGGSTALDMGRAVAATAKMDSIPTILSTACISVNKTIARENGLAEAIVAQTPEKTIVPLRTLMELPEEKRRLWSQSGFGDVFGRISASIDTAYRDHSLTHEQIIKNTPKEIRDGMSWVENNFQSYNQETMKELASLSHAASIEIVRSGDSSRSIGDEHKFYYKIMERHPEYNGTTPTHGQIVAEGTLISARAYGEKTGDFTIYNRLRSAFEKLGLPVTYSELKSINLSRETIVQGLNDISSSSGFLGAYFKRADFTLIDKIFGSQSDKDLYGNL
jgi:glycerol dehydrogenase-like iron-containing ADH family enzyme